MYNKLYTKYFLHFWPKFLNKIGLLSRINLVSEVRLNGHIVKIPIIYKLGFANIYPFESWMIELIKILHIDERGMFIDVGMNIGQTLIKVKSVHPGMKYIGFEPNPSCIFYLGELIRMNNFQETDIYPVGISSFDHVVDLNMYDENPTDSSASIIRDFREKQVVHSKVNVPVFNVQTLSKFNEKVKHLQILKIDVEGAELEVLTSFYELLKIHRPYILIEILPVYNVTNTPRVERQNKIEHFFAQLNYLMFRVEKNEYSGFKSLTFIDKIGIHSDLTRCDYILIPFEKQQVYQDFLSKSSNN